MANDRSYRCPVCDWHREPGSDDPESIVACAVEFEQHLVGAHDFSFRTTARVADESMVRALASPAKKPE